MITEQWRPVVGWEDRYEVSDRGRVASIERDQTYKDGHQVHYKWQLLKATPDSTPKGGYLRVDLVIPGGKLTRSVHRLVAAAFIGSPPPDRPNVCHNDGNKRNNVASNLRYDSQPANAADRKLHGTDTVGTKPRCVQGHLLQGANLAPYRSIGHVRVCFACRRASQTVYRNKKRGVTLDRVAEADRVYCAFIPGDDPAPHRASTRPAARTA